MGDASLDILIIEDEPETAKMLTIFLKQKFSANTQTAPDCKTARKMLLDRRFNLVTLDYQLPDGNGLDLLEDIQSMSSSPAVIMVTGHGDEKIASKSFTLGASGYVVKDNRLSVMLPEAVEHVLSTLELRRMEKEAEQEREKGRMYLEISAVMIIAMNNDGELSMVNRAGCELFGYEEKELIGKNFFDEFIPEIAREKARKSFARVIEGTEVCSKNYRLPQIGRDGCERTIAWHNALLKDEAGKTVGLLGSGTDITDQLRNERMVQTQRNLAIRLSATDDLTEIMSIYLQTIFDTTEFDCGGVYVKDEETDAFDYVYHQGLSQGFVNEYCHMPHDAPNAKLLLNGITLYTDYENIEAERTDAGKRESLKAIAIIPLTDKGETIGGVTLASHDTNIVSEYSKRMIGTLSDQIGQVLTRSRLSTALKNSAAKYRSLFNNSPEGIAVINQETVITDVNDVLCRWFSLSRNEVIGIKPTDLPFLSDKDKKMIALMRARRIAGQKVNPYTIEYTPEGGETQYYQVTGSIIDDNGSIIGGMVALNDITRRVLEEAKLKEYELGYKLVFENTRELIIILDQDGNIISINPAAVEALGYVDKVELIGTNIREYFMDIEDRKPLLRVILAEGYVKNCELTLKKKDGFPLNTKGSIMLYSDDPNRPVKYEAVLSDITPENNRA